MNPKDECRASVIEPDATPVAPAGRGGRTLAETSSDALRTVCAAFGWAIGVLWIFDPAKGALECAALWGADRLRDGAFATATRRLALSPGVGLPGRVWATGRPCWAEDVARDCADPRAADAHGEGLRTALACVVHARGEPVGVMELYAEAAAPADGDRIVGMTAVGDLLGNQIQLARSDESLRRSEETHRSLLETTTDIVWRTGAIGEGVERSPSWEAYTGQPHPGGLGFRWLDMVDPDDRASLATLWTQLGAHPHPVEVEFRLWNATSRRHRHVHARGMPLFDAKGGVREWVGTIVDVDDRRRAELAARFLADATALLNDSLDYDRTLADLARLTVPVLADICTVHIAEDGKLRTVAAAHRDPALAAEILERFRHEPTAQCDAIEVARTGHRKTFTTACEPCVGAGAPDGEGSVTHGGFHLCLPMCARGRTLGAICFVLLGGSDRRYGPDDKALCEELCRRAALAVDNADLYRAAQRAARAREEFFVIASHELRTPLTPLKLAVQALAKHLVAGGDSPATERTERTERLLATVERCTNRVAALVEELLDISQLSSESERLVLTPEPLDLATVVAEETARSQAMLGAAGCELQVHVSGETTGLWDRRWLEKALANLLSNAAKYGRGLPVEIRVEGDPDEVRLSVRDHGIGIPPEEQARIFDRFERAVSTRHYGGFGLGLWSVRCIVAAHGGSVRVDSRVGEGATFTITLPRRGPSASLSAPAGEEPSPQRAIAAAS